MIRLETLQDVLTGLISEYADEATRVQAQGWAQVAEGAGFLAMQPKTQERIARTLGAIEALTELKERVNVILVRENDQNQGTSIEKGSV